MRAEPLQAVLRTMRQAARFSVICFVVGGSPAVLANDEDRPDARTSSRMSESHETAQTQTEKLDEDVADKKTIERDKATPEMETVEEGAALAEEPEAPPEKSLVEEPEVSSETRLLGVDTESSLRELSIP